MTLNPRSKLLPTPAQLRIAAVLALGRDTAEAAADLGLATGTVSTTQSNANHRLGVRHRYAYIQTCYVLNLLPRPVPAPPPDGGAEPHEVAILWRLALDDSHLEVATHCHLSMPPPAAQVAGTTYPVERSQRMPPDHTRLALRRPERLPRHRRPPTRPSSPACRDPSVTQPPQGAHLVPALTPTHTPRPSNGASSDAAGRTSPPVLASALVTDTHGRVLVLSGPRPTGGTAVSLPQVQATGAHAPEAELAEVLYNRFGVHPHHARRLLAVDCEQWSPHLAVVCHLYLFGPLDEHRVRAIKTPPTVSGQWLAPEAAALLLPAPAASRLRGAVAAWHTGSVAHLVGGRIQPGSPAAFPPGQRAELEQSLPNDSDLHQAHRPKVLAEANVLLTDPAGRALLLHPTSARDQEWCLPGSGIDSDAGEGPREAARRVLRDQLSLDVPLGRLLAVDWVNGAPRLSRIIYTFHGTALGEHDLARIRLNPRQHTQWRMASGDDSKNLAREPLLRRLDACLTALWNNTGPVELRSGIPCS